MHLFFACTDDGSAVLLRAVHDSDQEWRDLLTGAGEKVAHHWVDFEKQVTTWTRVGPFGGLLDIAFCDAYLPRCYERPEYLFRLDAIRRDRTVFSRVQGYCAEHLRVVQPVAVPIQPFPYGR